jgi:hypothetical protein
MQTMLVEMRKPSESAGEHDSANDWQPLKVNLVDESGKPASGVVACQKLGPGGINEQASSNADGVCDFGALPIGQYSLKTAINSLQMSGGSTKALIRPGRSTELTIVTPSNLAEPILIHFEIEPPESLATQPLYYVALIWRRNYEVAGRSWYSTKVPILLLDAEGEVLGELSLSDWNRGEYENLVVNHRVAPPPIVEPYFKLAPPPKISPLVSDVFVFAYVAETLTGVEKDSRPRLKLLRKANLSRPLHIETASNKLRIGPDEEDFWTAVQDAIAESNHAPEADKHASR